MPKKVVKTVTTPRVELAGGRGVGGSLLSTITEEVQEGENVACAVVNCRSSKLLVHSLLGLISKREMEDCFLVLIGL